MQPAQVDGGLGAVGAPLLRYLGQGAAWTVSLADPGVETMVSRGSAPGVRAAERYQFGSERTEPAALVPPGGTAVRYRLRITRP